jgi:hypothetical protein
MEAVHFSRVTAVFWWIFWIWLLQLFQGFQCRATYWALVEMLLDMCYKRPPFSSSIAVTICHWHPTTDFISSHELLAQDIQTDSMKLLKRIRLETVVTVNHQQLRLWWTLSSSLWPQEAVGEMVNTSYGEGSVTIERISGRRTKRFALLTRSLHSSRQFFPW